MTEDVKPGTIAPNKNAPEKSRGQIILGWWGAEIGDRQSSSARALAARLRRASGVDALTEPAVHDLARRLHLRDGTVLVRVATLLAEVRDHRPQTLAQCLGGAEPVLSTLRFQRLMRTEPDDLVPALRRAIAMADNACNVAALGEDLINWSEATRTRWCFHYFGAAAPNAAAPSPIELDASKEMSE